MKKVILIFTLVLTAFAVNAQTKVGHINSSELLEQMPEAKTILTQLEAEQTKWQGILAGIEADIRKSYAEYEKASADPTYSKGQLEVLAAAIEAKQNQYQESQKTASKDLQQKQQDLYSPLLEKVKKAIEDVAKANGFDYVIDSMEGSGLIYSNPGNDLMPLVKTQLGL